MAGLHFDITGDNSNLLRKLQETEKGIKAVSQTVEKEGGSIESLFNRIAKSAAAFGAGFTAKEFVTQVAQVRGEFQKLEVAFTTMLGSKQKAEELMTQMVRTAATTPFGLQDVASGAKQLLAYGVAAEDVNQTLIRLGDIAAGLSIPLGDLVYLYGTTRAQGRLYTEDLNQFTGRGIPMIQELAKHFGVAEGKIKDMVSEGKVGFEEVQLAIESLTNEGGKFGGLMEAQSKTISGQISNIEDAIESMFNDIGKSSENVIRDALSGASYLVENYEKVGETIAVAVSAYGSYKAVLMTVSAVQSANNLILRQAVVERSLAAASGISLSNAESVATARTKLLTIAQRGLVKSLKSAAAATLANPYVLMAAAITSLTYGIYKLATYETEAEKKQRSLNEAIAESEAASFSEQRELAKLKGELSALSSGTKEYENVKNKIIKGFGKYYEGLDEEINRIGLTEVAYNKLTEAIQKSYGARQYEKFSKEQQAKLDETMSDSFMKIQNRLYEKLGDEQGSKIFTKLRNSLLSGNLSIGKRIASIEGLDKELKDALDKAAGANGGIFNVSHRKIETELANILKAQKLAEDIDRKAKVRFGIKNVLNNEESANPNNNTDELKNKSYWEARKKEAESARDALDVSKKNSKEWNEYTKQIEEAQKNIDKYSIPKDRPLKDANNLTKTQEKLNSQLLSLQRKNQQDEINLMEEGEEKRKAQADFIFQQALNDLETQAEEWRKVQGGNLSSEQIDELNRGEENAYQTYLNTINNITQAKKDADEKAWQDYYIAYGEYQEKRKAIEEKYNEELSKTEENSPQYMTIIAERKQALDELDETLMKDSGLWGDFFSDFSNRSSSAINALMKDIERLIAYMEGIEGVEMPDIFKDAEKSIKDAMSNPDTSQKFVKNLKGTLDKFNKMVEKDSPFKKISEGFKNKDSKSLADGFSGIASAASELGSVMEGLGVKSDSALGKATSALSSTASMAAQGAAIGGPWGAAAGAALGLATSLVGMFGADYSQYNSLKAEYEGLIDIWDSLISKKQQYIDIDYGIEAQKAADEAKKLVDTQISRQRQLAEALMGAGKSAGSHSLGYRVNDRMGGADWQRLSALTGSTIREVADVFRLDTDVIGKVLQDEKFVSVLTTVNSEFITYIENIEKYGEQLEEIAEQEKEAFTGTSFDEFRDSFISMLSDLDSTSEDFADNFEKYLQNAIFSSLIANKYKDRIQSLYDSWAKEAESGGKLDSTEAERLNAKYQQLVNEMISDRNEMMNNFGWKSEKEQQSASGKGFEAMGQDDAEELNGRFTALYEVSLQILQNISILQTISDSTGECNVTLLEIRNLMISSNGYLEDISVFVKKILEGFGEKLDNINTNIKNGLQ